MLYRVVAMKKILLLLLLCTFIHFTAFPLNSGKGPPILVAGAGHGGLLAAGLLARQGYDVHLYEKKARTDLGWDWHDNLKLDGLEKLKIKGWKLPSYIRVSNFTFISPDGKTRLVTEIPLAKREVAMDRKELIESLVQYAEVSGVVLHFEATVEGPLIEKGEEEVVAGLIVNGEKKPGAMVIDSAGLESPVRSLLPSSYTIVNKIPEGDFVYAYRAYYNIKDIKGLKRREYLVYTMPDGLKGIVWLRLLEGSCDFLVASLKPLNEKIVSKILNKVRKTNPGLGGEVVRGGRYARIPLRRSLDLFVGHNYAAIGDAAAMTVPVMGSGIENSLQAAVHLAETVKKIGKVTCYDRIVYEREDLWHYQYCYYQTTGARMCFLDCFRRYLFTIKESKLNALFSKGVMTAQDMQKPLMGEEIRITGGEMAGRFFRAWYRPDLLIPLKSLLGDAEDAKKTALSIPAVWNRKKVAVWRKELGECFE